MRRRRTGLAPLGALVLVLVAAVACGGGAPGGRTERELARPGNFSNGRDAAGALATVSARLIERSERCRLQHPDDPAPCETIGVAIAWTQVAAVDVARCGRADALAARATLVTLLDQVDASERGAGAPPPAVPPTPSCR